MTVFVHTIYNTQIKNQALRRQQSSIPGCKELNLFSVSSDKERDLQATAFILAFRP